MHASLCPNSQGLGQGCSAYAANIPHRLVQETKSNEEHKSAFPATKNTNLHLPSGIEHQPLCSLARSHCKGPELSCAAHIEKRRQGSKRTSKLQPRHIHFQLAVQEIFFSASTAFFVQIEQLKTYDAYSSLEIRSVMKCAWSG